jgi:hypothetical protein
MMQEWTSRITNIFPSKAEIDLVISPDVDGLLSAAIVNQRCRAKVIGIYTTKHVICLGDQTSDSLKNAIWLDHDISRPDITCVGQHLVLHDENDRLDLVCKKSFNPNTWVKQAFYGSFQGRNGRSRDKYPFGTAHLLSHAFGMDSPDPETPAFSALAHADGTWATTQDYQLNCKWWRENFFVHDSFLDNLSDDYCGSEKNLKLHKGLVLDLLAANVRTRSARSAQSPLIRAEWQDLQGHQSPSISLSMRARDPRQMLQSGIDKLESIQNVLSKYTGMTLPEFDQVSSWESGKFNPIYPNQIERGDLNRFMKENNIFSHAFTLQSRMNYTTELFD